MTRRRQRTLLALSLASATVGWAWPAPAQTTTSSLSVDEIVRRTNHAAYYQGRDGRARAKMTITDAQGRQRVKEFTILRLNEGEGDGDQRFYVYFHQPADERGVTFMVWKHLDKDDDRWLYLPGLDVQKRIAASDKRTSFVGSSFFYEDVSGRRTDEDTHELVETTDNYYVLKNVPKKPELVEFDSFTMWIHRATFVPVEVRYEKGGEVYRVMKALAVDDVQGHKTVTRSEMRDVRGGGSTLLEYSKVDYDLGLEPDLFTERYLRAPPQALLE
jgi:hypothetical protein